MVEILATESFQRGKQVPAKIPFRLLRGAFHARFLAVVDVWYDTCNQLVATPPFCAHVMTEAFLPGNATSIWELGSSMPLIIIALILSPLLVMGWGVWFWIREYGKLKSRQQKTKALGRTVLALLVVPPLLLLVLVWLSWRAMKKWKGQRREKKRDDIV
jgi:heme/copper-type cytochrome/quinol oxidase subunit 2